MMHLSMMLDPDTCMYDAYIYVPRSLILIHACMMHKAMILALDPEACMYAWCIYDSGPWSWMYDACNNASFSRICVYMMLPDACMHDAYIYYSWPFTLMHVCMMHNAQIYDSVPWSWWCMNLGRCMYIWCGTFWGRTDERTNKAILGVGSMILDLDSDALVYVSFLTVMFVCMCDA